MLIFRWVIGVLGALFAVGAAFGFAIFVASESQVWLERSRRLRHWLWLVLLFWFNVEVWGRVIWALFHWNSG